MGTDRTTMRAVRLTAGEPPRLEEVRRGELGRHEVRLGVAYTAICFTDVHFIDGERAARMADEVTLGHEMSGTVLEVGADVHKWSVGDRVISNPLLERDGQSWVMGVHFDGSWADEVVVPAEALVSIGDIDFRHASVIPDAVSTPWAAITTTAGVRPAESAAVWGIGGLGYHAVQLLRVVGAAPIVAVDPNAHARGRAVTAGADIALDPGDPDFDLRLKNATGGRGVDVAFDFFGHPRVHQQAFDALARNGRLVLVGVPTTELRLESAPNLIRLGKSIIGHYGAERRHLEQIVSLVEHGRLDLSTSVSAVMPLHQFGEGLETLRTKETNPVRILLDPSA